MNNRNTTVAGIGAILVAIGGVMSAMFDGDTTTVPDWTSAVAAVIAGIGLILAKDAANTSPAPPPTDTGSNA